MRLYCILTTLLFSVFSAQTHRFIYEYSYIPNLNKKDFIQKEMMALDITKDGSSYESIVKIQRDSIIHAQINTNLMSGNLNLRNTMGQTGKTTVPYKVLKEYPSDKTYLIQQVDINTYKILEDEKIDWKIHPDISQIGEYKAQKATTNWGGRNWIAWFATDLPFSDGPYKFKGLPGLIVKIEDEANTHIMTLVENRVLKSLANNTSKEIVRQEGNKKTMVFFGKEIPVSETQFKKVWKEHIADPAKNFRGRLGTNVSPDGMSKTIVITTKDGKELNERDLEKMMKERVKKSIEENNNRIEPTLYE